MRRTGSALVVLALLWTGVAGAADIEFYQTVDRTEVGVSDVFTLTVVLSNAQDGSKVTFPVGPELETLNRTESQQQSMEFINGRFNQKNSRTWRLTLRALKPGTVHIPASVLDVRGHLYKTEPITLTVRRGHVSDPNPAHPRPQDPLSALGFPPMPDPRQMQGGIDVDDDNQDIPDTSIPGQNSDLFLRSVVDKSDAYVGEQLTFSVFIYSRVELSAVDPVSMPKLDGFWSEEIDSPDRLAPEQKILNGIPYRVYLIKRRAIFPVKSGTFTITGAEADITTGFLFAGRRVHREGNALTIKVKPLPTGAPAGFGQSNVGAWKMTVEAAPTQVELGGPVNLKVTVEGRGNVRDLILPKLVAPAGVKVFDPTTTDKVQAERFRVVGKRTQEYVVMPQQTGTFTLPGLTLPYFNPEQRRYEATRTEPVILHVTPGAGGATSLARNSGTPGTAGGAKNVLAAGGLRPLRYQATFEHDETPLWKKAFFLPALALPPLAWAFLGVLGLVRGRLSREDPSSLTRRKLKAARGRLDEAEKLKAQGTAQAFYGEVERSLLSFLEAKLGGPVGGLTREALSARMTAAQISGALQMRVRTVLDECDVGRFAPGADAGARGRVLDEAASVMEGWPA